MTTSAQIKLIHTATNVLGLPDDIYRDILWENWRVGSCTDLTDAQARDLIRRLEELGFKPKPRKKEPAGKPKSLSLPVGSRQVPGGSPVNQSTDAVPARPGSPDYRPDPEALVNPRQQAVLESLFEVRALYSGDRAGICRKIIKKPWPQSQMDGQKMIYALLSMHAGDLIHEIEQPRLDRQVTEWERGFLFADPGGALAELKRFHAAKGKRGGRKMPKVSLTKLFEIINKYNNARV